MSQLPCIQRSLQEGIISLLTGLLDGIKVHRAIKDHLKLGSIYDNLKLICFQLIVNGLTTTICTSLPISLLTMKTGLTLEPK
jgi:hypothetical protein